MSHPRRADQANENIGHRIPMDQLPTTGIYLVVNPFTPHTHFLFGYIQTGSGIGAHWNQVDEFSGHSFQELGSRWEFYRDDETDIRNFYIRCKAWDEGAYLRRGNHGVLDGSGATGDVNSLWRVTFNTEVTAFNVCSPTHPDHMLFSQPAAAGRFLALFGIPPVYPNPPQPGDVQLAQL